MFFFSVLIGPFTALPSIGIFLVILHRIVKWQYFYPIVLCVIN